MSAFTDWIAVCVENVTIPISIEDAFNAGPEAAAKVCEEMHERKDDNCGEAANCIHAMKEGQMDKTPQQIAIEALDSIVNNDSLDKEEAHLSADGILLDLLAEIGHAEVAAAYNRVCDHYNGFWYA